MRKITIRLQDTDYKIIIQLKGRRSWPQYLLSINHSVHTRQHAQEVIYRNFQHMLIDLPEEMEGMINTLQMIGLRSLSLNDKEREGTCKRLVEALYEKQE